MKQKKKLAFLTLMVLVIVNSSIIQAQDDEPTRVAILVVDLFEPMPGSIDEISREYSIEEDADNPLNCAVAVDGQDDYKWDGGAAMSGIFPNPVPHGDLVYLELALLLQDEQWNFVSPLSGIGHHSADDWIHDVTLWEKDGNEIVLIGVDAGYLTNKITYKIEKTIEFLSEGTSELEPIDRFVVNMSFGLVPCEGLAELQIEEYERVVNDDIVCEDDPPEDDDLRAELHDLKCGLSNLSSWGRVIKLKSLLGQVERDGILVNWRIPSGDQLSTVFNTYYTDERKDEFECDNFYLDHDPLAELFGQYIPDPCSPEPERSEPPYVIFVASAGNDGKNFPYAPAMWPMVLSVSADYDFHGECTPSSEEDIANFLEESMDEAVPNINNIANQIVNPHTNSGEVKEYGVSHLGLLSYLGIRVPEDFPLGCLTGTSFAAPRVSIQQAEYLARGYTNVCEHSNGTTVSSPPLAYIGWDNLPIDPDAASLYCDDFLP